MELNRLLRRQWIPPWALLFAQLAHGAAWVLLVYAAARFGVRGLTPGAVAWIHVVALGWITMAALAILLHVIPRFTDLPWRGEALARHALGLFAIGVVLFIVGWFASTTLVVTGAVTIGIALVAYLTAAFATLGGRTPIEPTERAIARALAMTLGIFTAVALLGGFGLAALEGAAPATWIARVPPAHAVLGIFGWFTILIVGVAARTMRPICGVRSRFPRLHAIVGSALVLGAPLLALGILGDLAPLRWSGATLVALGCIVYIVDAADIVRRATRPHRPPQAFVVASLVWLALGILLGGALLAGVPCGEAFGYVLLVGWVGQMVNAHVFHLGVRVISTTVRGDDDETRPGLLLDERRSWMTFVGMQLAVAIGGYGLLRGNADDAIVAGILGAAAWFVMMTNLVGAYFNAFEGTKTSASPSMQ